MSLGRGGLLRFPGAAGSGTVGLAGCASAAQGPPFRSGHAEMAPATRPSFTEAVNESAAVIAFVPPRKRPASGLRTGAVKS